MSFRSLVIEREYLPTCLLHLLEQAHEFIPPFHSIGPYELTEKNEFDENVKTRLAEYIKDKRFNRAGKKTETQFWLDIKEMLSHYRNDRDHRWNHSSIRTDFQRGFRECPRYQFGLDCHVEEPFKLHFSVPNPHRDTEYQFGYTYGCNQLQKRKQILRCYSSFVVSTVVLLGILFNTWSSLLSFIQVQPLHKEHGVSIWPPLLGLFGFMVFVCAIALMVLSGAPFTSMQKTMLIFLVILMHLQLANSISEVFVLLVGGVFMGWVAFGKNNCQMK